MNFTKETQCLAHCINAYLKTERMLARETRNHMFFFGDKNERIIIKTVLSLFNKFP